MSSQFQALEDQDSTVDQIATAASQASQQLQLWTDSVEEEDPNLAKSPTLMLDEAARSALESAPLMPEAKPKYVQGVVSGNQVYLVTNLINHTSQTFYQPQMVWTIGRNRMASLPLPDRKLSRRHAVIMYAPNDGFYLIDLNSMNGSYINGSRVQNRKRLQDGDCICLGGTRFFFFVSQQSQTLEPIHAEVFARLNNAETRSTPFIDFSELNEEISFNLAKQD